ncbi:uncharacterized protein EHS24_004163 [Apiotrichum porosum]|uniref:HORMA domain-containing protein n=1 Tax=Apiotrichum porosum TaxID=105984 RepID=A0A427Y4E8_9TREE|nr:uncharacterized protein EHS24_004163 [Apiotrichum porosum]RSH85976.1 hypothetical protein EHS24_004163 [Apiotrichum porosum]
MANAKAGPSRLHVESTGVSFKHTVDTITSFLEVVFHTILCIRNVYPATTFTRRRAHGVPVYQSRHPEVRGYLARVVAALSKELEKGTLRRVTLVIKSVATGVPLERFILDAMYMGLESVQGPQKDVKIVGAPSPEGLSLLLRAFLTRLTAMDGQLSDITEETTFTIIAETNDDLEPGSSDGASSPWAPALQGDTLAPLVGHHAPLYSVRAIETGVIDLRMLVQECAVKHGVDDEDVAAAYVA